MTFVGAVLLFAARLLRSRLCLLFLFPLLVQFRIAGARMVYSFQALNKHLFGYGYIVERYRACTEESVLYLLVDKFVDEVGYALFCIFLQRACGGLYRVGHHQDGLLAGKRVGARVCKQRVVDRFVRMFVLV